MGSLAIFVRNIDANPILITFFRLFFGMLFIAPFVRNLEIKKPKIVFVVALMNLTTILFYIASIQMVEAATAALLLYMAPIYVIVILLFTGESIDRRSLLALPLGLLGLYLMLSPYGGISLGIAFGILSGLSYAVLFILMKRVREFMSSVHITFINLAIPSLALTPFVLLYSSEAIGVLTSNLYWILGLGLIPTALAFTIFSYGIKFCKTEKAPILALIEPVAAGIFGYYFFGEVLTLKQIAGASLISFSVAVAHSK
jgi:drug/metabolite transporter (DMT)-like permease